MEKGPRIEATIAHKQELAETIPAVHFNSSQHIVGPIKLRFFFFKLTNLLVLCRVGKKEFQIALHR